MTINENILFVSNIFERANAVLAEIALDIKSLEYDCLLDEYIEFYMLAEEENASTPKPLAADAANDGDSSVASSVNMKSAKKTVNVAKMKERGTKLKEIIQKILNFIKKFFLASFSNLNRMISKMTHTNEFKSKKDLLKYANDLFRLYATKGARGALDAQNVEDFDKLLGEFNENKKKFDEEAENKYVSKDKEFVINRGAQIQMINHVKRVIALSKKDIDLLGKTIKKDNILLSASLSNGTFEQVQEPISKDITLAHKKMALLKQYMSDATSILNSLYKSSMGMVTSKTDTTKVEPENKSKTETTTES